MSVGTGDESTMRSAQEPSQTLAETLDAVGTHHQQFRFFAPYGLADVFKNVAFGCYVAGLHTVFRLDFRALPGQRGF